MAWNNSILTFLTAGFCAVVTSALAQITDDPVFTDTNTAKTWWLRTIDLPEAWRVTKGSPDIVIAIVDDGVQVSHEEFQGRIKNPKSFYNDTGTMVTEDWWPFDFLDHGTPVAALAAAGAGNGVGSVGVCPDCSIMPIQLRGLVDTFSHGSIIWGVLTALEAKVDVINLSIGGDNDEGWNETFIQGPVRSKAADQLKSRRNKFLEDYFSHSGEHDLKNLSLDDLFGFAEQLGVLVVVAAGNDSVPGDLSDVCYHRTTLCVGSVALRTDGVLAPAHFSNYGIMVQVSAPGQDIFTAAYDDENTDGYGWENGTSMSAPLVAGLAGLLLSQNPDLTPTDLRQIIVASALPLMQEVQHKTGAYKSGITAEVEVLAWRQAFLLLTGRNEALQLDGPALQVLADLIPNEFNSIWHRPLTPKSGDTLCASVDWQPKLARKAIDSDDCAKYVGPLMNAARAMELLRLGTWRGFFAQYSEDELADARELDPEALMALARERGAFLP